MDSPAYNAESKQVDAARLAAELAARARYAAELAASLPEEEFDLHGMPPKRTLRQIMSTQVAVCGFAELASSLVKTLERDQGDAPRLAAELAVRARYAVELAASLPDDERALRDMPLEQTLRRAACTQAAVYSLAGLAAGLAKALECAAEPRQLGPYSRVERADEAPARVRVAEPPSTESSAAQIAELALEIGLARETAAVELRSAQTQSQAELAEMRAEVRALSADLDKARDTLGAAQIDANAVQAQLQLELAEVRTMARDLRADLDETQEALFDSHACMHYESRYRFKYEQPRDWRSLRLEPAPDMESSLEAHKTRMLPGVYEGEREILAIAETLKSQGATPDVLDTSVRSQLACLEARIDEANADPTVVLIRKKRARRPQPGAA